MAESSNPGRINRVSGFLNKPFLHVVIICLLGLVVYSNTFHVPFQWDEDHFITANPVVKNLSFFVSPSHAPVQFYGSIVGRYVGYLTFALNYKIGGLNVVGYHIFNLAVHILNAILLYFLIVLTFRTPYFSDQQSAIGHQRQALSCQLSAISGQQTARGKPGWQAIKLSGYQQEARGNNPPSSPLNLRGDRGGLRFIDSQSLIALFAALLFVSHPLQIEAVTYIFQRLASLAALFYLLSIVFYIKGRLSSRQTGKLAGFFLSLLFAVLAMKTKENAFTLPIIIILYEFLFLKGPKKTRALFLLPISLTLLIIPVTLLLTSGVVINPFDPSSMVFKQIPRWDYFITQSRVLVTYLRLFSLPLNQDIDYNYPVFRSLLEPAVLLSFVFLILLFGLAVYLFFKSRQAGNAGCQAGKLTSQQAVQNENRQADKLSSLQAAKAPLPPTSNHQFLSVYYRLIAFGIFWFFITLSVESSFQPIPLVIDEYRMYLPMAGVAAAASVGLYLLYAKLKGNKRGLAAVLLPVLLIAAFSTAAYTRNSVWCTRVSLWKDAAGKSPGKATVHANLGVAYYLEGDLDKAISQYELSLRLDPLYKETYYQLCLAYCKKNSPDMAIRYCRTAASLLPGSIPVHYNLALMYLAKGLVDDARYQLRIILQKDPGFGPARQLLEDIR